MALFHVHMGLPKTGSTTFQNALHLNREILSEDLTLINRMRAGPQRQGLLRAHASIRQSYRTGVDIAALRTHLETACAGPLADLPSDRPVLITDEGLSGPHPGQFKGHAGVFPALPGALHALAAVLPGDHTVFHLVTRDTGSWVRSLYGQAVKQTGYTHGLEAFEATFPDGFDITTHMQAVCDAHPDLDIRLHRMEDHAVLPAEQILLACGVAPALLHNLQIPARKNQSWSQPMLQAMRVINGAEIDAKSRNILRREFARQRDVFTGK